jgi:predicted outer membrane repeat protein
MRKYYALCLCILLFHLPSFAQTVIYVNGTTGNDLNTGASWAQAYSTVTNAITKASAGTEIWVAKGSYTAGTAVTSFFTLKEGVKIYGGFAGTETTLAQRNMALIHTINETILEGTHTSNNAYHVVNNTSAAITAATVLDGFVIKGGKASVNTSPTERGGGIYNNAGSPIFSNLIIKDNTAMSYGAGIYNAGSGSASFINIILQNNITSGGTNIQGGGIYNASANAVFTNVELIANSAALGGAIYSTAAASFSQLICRNNTATTQGGAIYATGAIQINRGTFINNSAVQHGGAIFTSAASRIENSIFSRNKVTSTSTFYGGAIYNSNAGTIINNSSFSGNSIAYVNTSAFGGALYSTVAGITISNSIFWGNNRGNAVADQLNTAITNISYSIVQGGFANGSTLALDPLFENAGADNLNIKAGSPAINSGNNASTATETDISGNTRIKNGVIDLGAYETDHTTGISIQTNIANTINRGQYFNTAMQATGGNGNYSWSLAGGALPVGFSLSSSGMLTGTSFFTGNYSFAISVTDGTLQATRWYSGQIAAGNGRIYVSKSATTGNNTGVSWANAFTDLQSIQSTAIAGDEVWVGKGDYSPGTAVTATFTLIPGVKIYGGFAGTETAIEQRDTSKIRTINETILNGNDVNYHVVSNTVAVSNTTVLDGFTIANGNAAATSGSNSYGGGIYNVNASAAPLLANLWIKDNAALRGAGMYNTGTPNLNNVLFENNATTATYGGGLWNTAAINLNQVQFIGNKAITSGGGMHNTGAAILNSVLFNNNEANIGGGLYTSGTANISLTQFLNNKSLTTGGGMHNIGSPVMNQIQFINNTAAQHGGGVYTMTGSLKIDNAIFSRNKVTGTGQFYGGGLYNGGTVNLSNISFSNNTIAYINTDTTLRFGAGLYNSGTANVYNSILWGNKRGNECNDPLNSGTVGSSIVQGGFNGSRIFLGEPLFENSPADNLRLRPGSLAIDAGDNTKTSTATDLDNNTRVINNTVDLGAYEIQANTGLQINTVLPASITRGQEFTQQLTATGGNGVYTWNVNGGQIPNGLILGTNGLLSGTPTVVGNFDFSVIVSDGNIFGSKQFNLQITSGAARVYVHAAATGANNGISWSNAFTDLQQALAIATSGDEVWVAKGTYSPGNAVTSSFSMVNGVKIYGGFAGNENQLTERDPNKIHTVNESILDGGNNAYHVIYNAGPLANNTLLDGFTITGGKTLTGSTGDNYQGAGIYNNNTTISAVFRNLIIRNNSAVIGGGIYNKGSSVNFSYIELKDNTSTGDGAGLYNTGATIAFTNAILQNNIAGGNGAGMYTTVAVTLADLQFLNNQSTSNGGGFYNAGISSLTNITFNNNQAAVAGGMYNASGNSLLNNVIFNGNSATGNAGAMYIGGNPVLTDVRFINNNAGGLGGAVQSASGPTLNRVAFINNSSVQHGGGMYSSGSVRLHNVLFSRNKVTGNNTSGYGGGFYHNAGTAVLTNITFSNNTVAYVHATSLGGGGLFYRASGTVSVYNSIFWNNTRGNSVPDQIGGSITITNSIVQNGYATGTSILMTDPLFENALNDSLQLKASSSAIDIGNNARVTTDKDLGGDNRIYNTTVDLGAYEYQGGGNSVRIQETTISALTRGTAVNTQLTATGGSGNYTWSIQSGTLPSGVQLTSNGLLTGTPMLTGSSNVVIVVSDGSLSGNRQFTITVNAGSARIHVRQGATGANSGANWTNAMTTMTAALAIAQAGDEIWVAKGTYTPGNTVNSYFTLKEGVKWYGGFAGTENTLTDRDTSKIRNINETILSGGNISYHVIYNIATTITNATVVDGFTVSGGKTATGSTGESYYGAGIYNGGGSPIFNYLWIKNNIAHYYGGGAYNTGTPIFSNIIFQDNTASSHSGGGLYNTGAINISKSYFIGNTSLNNGGGMFNNTTITISDIVFSKNKAALGGGLYNTGANNLLGQLSFIENNATSSGAGMYNTAAATFTDVIFRKNIATVSGGGLYNTGAAMLNRVCFFGNSATQHGGGLWSNNSPKLDNVAFSNNKVTGASGSAYYGGGMYFSVGTATLVNTSFSNNSINYTNSSTTVKYGGGFYLASGSANISNSIFWGNTRGGSVADQLNAGVNINNSIVQQGYSTGTNILIGDPLFVNAGTDSLKIKSGSAAIDAGDNSKVSTPRDLGNATRIINNTVDLGAYENQGGDIIAIQQVTIANQTRGTAVNIQMTGIGGTGIYSWSIQSGNLPVGVSMNAAGQISGVPMVTGSYTFVIAATDGELVGAKQYTVQVGAGNTIIHTFSGATGQNNGSSWQHAIPDLQTALSQAIAGDQIWVASGSYTPGNTVSSTFTLKEGVKMYGGFAGTETSLSARDTSKIRTNHETILNGGNVNYHVVYNIAALTNATVLDGFTISGGKTLTGNTGANYSGGGFYNIGGSPTLNHLTIKNNNAHYGGGIYNTGNPVLSNIQFISNKASQQGGGLYNTGNPSITNALFRDNSSTVTGGGFFNTGAPQIDKAIFQQNGSVQSGAGMYQSGGNATLSNTVFYKNAVSSTGNYAGAAIYSNAGTVTLINSTIAYNTTAYVNASTTTSYGAGLFRNGGTLNIHNSIVWGNTRGGNVPDQLNTGNTISYSIIQQGYAIGSNILIGDPQFVNAGIGDLRLKPGSSAIDAGNNARNTTTKDLLGNDRVFNDVIDLGAYENQGGGALMIRPVVLNNIARGQETNVPLIATGGDNNYTWSLESGILPPGLRLTADGILKGYPVTVGTYTFVIAVNDATLRGSKQYTWEVTTGPAKLKVSAAANGKNNGSSWEDAFTDLITALNIAQAGDELWVAKGIYSPGTKTSSSFILKEGIKIYGGFGATEVTLQDRDTSKIRIDNETILTGNNISYHVVFNTAALSNATVLDGFSITRGKTATGNTGESYYGAGIYNTNGAVIFNRLWVKNNVADYYGGGIFNQAAAATFSKIKLESNTAMIGGGMYNSVNATLTELEFHNNTASSHGGGLYNVGAATITRSTFTENKTSRNGGGIYTTAALTASDMVFEGNTATGNGGGFWSNAAATISTSRFSNNQSNGHGGAIFNSGNSTFDRLLCNQNRSGYNGGAIYNSGTSTVSNSAFSRNRVSSTGTYYGGAIYNISNTLSAINLSISKNSISYVNSATNSSYGGAIYRSSGTVTLSNSILWGNVRGNAVADQLNAGITVSHSIIQNGYTSGTDILIGDPGFRDADTDSLQLRNGSNAIDIGLNEKNTSTKDLAGQPRFFNDVIDLGAYEHQGGDAIVIAPANIPFWQRGTDPQLQLTALGGSGNYTWSLQSGQLPIGIRLTSTGLLEGVPMIIGKYTFVIAVTDGSMVGSKQYTVQINKGAAKIHVDAAASGFNNGSNWANAINDLQTALAQASAGDEIWVARGTYSPGNKTSSSFILKDSVKLYGGFGATETTLSSRDTALIRTTNETILTGSNINYHVVFNNTALSNTTVIDGFTISNGKSITNGNNYLDAPYVGAGLYNDHVNSKLVIRNTLFKANQASTGGGVYTTGTPLFENVRFENNTALFKGGGSYSGGAANFSKGNWNNNTAQTGGGIFNAGAATYSQSIITNNNATTGGGGIYSSTGNMTLSEIVFEANTATQHGAAWYSYSGTHTITDIIFRNNRATLNAGAIFFNSGGIIANRVNFTGNTAVRSGGAFYNNGGNLSLTNAVFSRNKVNSTSSYYGGAFYHASGISNIINASFGGNSIAYSNTTATNYGGAVYRNSGTVNIYNSIFWNNTRGAGRLDQLNTISSFEQSMVQGGYTGGTNIVDANPLFMDEATDSLQLKTGSIAINAGSNGRNSTLLDVAKNTRIIDGIIDLGAYESSGGNGLSIAPVSLGPLTRGTAPATQLTATGGTGAITWNLQSGKLPTGLTLTSDGKLTGTPMVTGTYTFVVNAVDATELRGSRQYIVQVNAGNARIHVYGGATGNNDGNDWTHAFIDLQTALVQAVAGDEVWVAKGTYSPGTKTSSSFVLKDKVKLYGGFGATETSLSMRDSLLIASTNETILSGNNINYHVVFNNQALTNATVLDGFTIANGKAVQNGNNYVDPPYVGAGLYNDHKSSALIARNLVFSNNRASNGGAIYNTGTPTFINIRIIGNSALFRGGGIYSAGGGTYKGMKIEQNTAQSGGGMFNSGNINVDSLVLTGNTASSSGGGLYTSGTGVKYSRVSFENNSSTVTGGAVYTNSGTLNFDRARFINNTSVRHGAAIYNNTATLTVTNSIFSRNKVTGTGTSYGGAIYHYNGISQLINNSFSNNSIAYTNSSAVNSYGGAIYKANGTLTLFNSILWNNVRGSNTPDQLNAGITANNNLIMGGYGNTGIIIKEDPLFNNANNDDLSISGCSPAINMGDPSKLNGVSLDISDSARIQWGVPDIGAYESKAATISITPTTLSNGNRGAGYEQQLTATGGNGNYTYKVAYGKLPDGLAISSSGLITGVPIRNGSYTFNIAVTDGTICGNLLYTMDILPGTGTSRIYVNNGAVNGQNNGSTWSNGYIDLQEAILVSQAGDEIWVAKGTYSPGTARSTWYVLKEGVKLYGGFAGTEQSLSDRDSALIRTTNETILSGNNNNYHVVYNNVALTNATLVDGFTISGGKTLVSGTTTQHFYGGGLYNEIGSPVLRNLVFKNNTGYYGAGMFNGGSPTLSNVLFEGNTASYYGGGLFTQGNNANPVLTQVKFTNNTSSRHGGGMYVGTGKPMLTDIQFSGNKALSTYYGGGLYNAGATQMQKLVFTDNSANYGGGLFNSGKNVVANELNFRDNQARSYGGAAYVSGTITFNQVISTGNTSSMNGAAFFTAGTAKITNAIFSRNKINAGSYYGGAIYANSGALTVTNSSFSNNSIAYTNANVTKTYGGAIFRRGGVVNVYNSIFWNNKRGNNVSDQLTSGITIANSIVEGGYATGKVIIANDPQFIDASNDDLTLGKCSPAINMGDNTKIAGITTDLKLQNRIQETTVDLGALENQDSRATITPAILPAGIRGTNYNQQLSVSGGSTSATYAVTYGKLPDGLVMSENGLISGKPIAVGSFDFNVVVNDGALCGNQLYKIDITQGAGGVRIYVNSAATNGANNGGDWENGYLDLQQALKVSMANDSIWVAKGTYSPGATATSWFVLKENVKIFGGFAGTEKEFIERDSTAIHTSNETILGGTKKTLSYHIIFNNAALTNKTVLDGFTISDGRTASTSNTTSANYVGGGIYNANATSAPVFRNLIIKNNRAVNGGGMYNTGIPTLVNVQFMNNSTTTSYGGALYNTGAINLNKVTFTGNTAASYGGAVYTSTGKAIFNEVSFINNSTPNRGGAIYINSGAPVFTDLIMRDNRVTGNNNGGAIYINTGSSPVITHALFINNSANYSGGAIYNSGTLKLANAAFSRNRVISTGTYYGGAIYTTTGTMTITNSSFSRNSIGYVNASKTLSYGGAINRYSGTVTINNSIFWNNQRGNAVADQMNAAITVNTSLVEGGYSTGKLILTTDPMFQDATADSLQLASCSPAVNLGDNSKITGITKDITGNDRIKNDIVDLGAYEYQGQLLVNAEQTLPEVRQWKAYQHQLTAGENGTDSTYQFNIIYGALPDGFTMTPNGLIEGTAELTGEYEFGVSVKGADICGTMKVKLTILPKLPFITEVLPPYPLPIDVKTGTTFQQLNLINKVEVVWSDKTKSSVPVTWQEGTYNGDVVGKYIIEGLLTVDDPEQNPDSLTASATIVVIDPISKYIVAVQKSDSLVVLSKTAFSEIQFPEKVEVTYNDSTKEQLSVQWKPGSYQTKAGIYRIYGDLILTDTASNPAEFEALIDVHARNNIISVELLSDINVALNTPADSLPLPATIKVMYNDSTTSTLAVEWNKTPYISNKAGTYTLSGTLVLKPNTMNTNNLMAGMEVHILKKVVAISPLDTIHVPFETSFDALPLPDSVTVEYNDGTTGLVVVNWQSEQYDGTQTGEQEIKGEIIVEEGVSNEDSLQASIKVTVLPKPRNITAIAAIDSISVPYGTNATKLLAYLPQKAFVSFDNNSTDSISLQWENGEYDPLQPGTYQLTGIPILLENDRNMDSMKAEILVTVLNKYLIKVNPSDTIQVANGTSFSLIDLPDDVTVQYNDSSTGKESVIWSANLYDSSLAGYYTITGTIETESETENHDSLTGQLVIRVMPPPLAIEELIPITDTISIPYGTLFANALSLLPNTAKVIFNNRQEDSIQVQWEESGYLPNESAVYLITGQFILPDTISNPLNIQPSIYVKVGNRQLMSITPVDTIKVAYGTAWENIALPESVQATYSDMNTEAVSVIWERGDYDSSMSGLFTLSGELLLPEEIDNPLNLKAVLLIQVEKKQKDIIAVQTDTVRVAFGTSFDQLVLPTTTTALFSDSTTGILTVTSWNEGSFDPAIIGQYLLAGTISLPDTIQNPDILTAQALVILEPKYVVQVGTLTSITTNYGTAFNELILPDSVNVHFNDGSDGHLMINWLPGSYDGNIPGTYLIQGELLIEDETIANRDSLFAQIEITVLTKPRVLLRVATDSTEVAYGTSFASITLPATLEGVFDDSTTATLNIQWQVSDYNPLQSGVYIIQGIPTLPADAINSQEIMAFFQIRVGPKTIVAVQASDTLQVAFNTAYELIGLPENSMVTFNDGTTQLMAVEWQPGTYNPAVSGIYTLAGHIVIEEGMLMPDSLQPVQVIAVAEEMPNILHIDTLAAISVPYKKSGLELQQLLPQQLGITYENLTLDTLNIIWDLTDYDSSIATTYSIKGALQLRDGTTNTKDLYPVIQVTVNKKNIVSVAPLDTVQALYGQSFAALVIPENVLVTYDDGSEDTLTVTWKEEDYQPAYLGTQHITGTLQWDESVTNLMNLTARLPISSLRDILSFTALLPKDVVYGTSYTALSLPASIGVTYTDNSTGTMPITWDSTAYNSANAGLLTLTAGFILPADVYNSNDLLVAQPINITKAPLTIKADHKNRKYGATNPIFTIQVTGLVKGETLSTLGGGEAITDASTNSPVGEYDIDIRPVTSVNYEVTYEQGLLTIEKALLTITANDRTRKYGETDSLFTASYAGFVNEDSVGVLIAPAVISTVATISSSVGEYPITAADAVAENYEISYVAGKLTITKADLQLIAEDKIREQGTANPTLTYTAIGLMGSDQLSSILSTEPVLSTVADITSIGGQFPILITGGTAINYNISNTNGIMHVVGTAMAPLPASGSISLLQIADYMLALGEITAAERSGPISLNFLNSKSHLISKTAPFRFSDWYGYAPVAGLPRLVSNGARNITSTTGTSGGFIVDIGGVSITARGICWSTEPEPTIAQQKTTDGTGTGAFTSELTGLQPGTKYYIRAYATSSAGTAYGNQVIIVTQKSNN